MDGNKLELKLTAFDGIGIKHSIKSSKHKFASSLQIFQRIIRVLQKWIVSYHQKNVFAYFPNSLTYLSLVFKMKMFGCFVFILICFFKFSVSTCPPGSFEEKSNCLIFNSNDTEFANAESACSDLGGHLVSIHDAFANLNIARKF